MGHKNRHKSFLHIFISLHKYNNKHSEVHTDFLSCFHTSDAVVSFPQWDATNSADVPARLRCWRTHWCWSQHSLHLQLHRRLPPRICPAHSPALAYVSEPVSSLVIQRSGTDIGLISQHISCFWLIDAHCTMEFMFVMKFKFFSNGTKNLDSWNRAVNK